MSNKRPLYSIGNALRSGESARSILDLPPDRLKSLIILLRLGLQLSKALPITSLRPRYVNEIFRIFEVSRIDHSTLEPGT